MKKEPVTGEKVDKDKTEDEKESVKTLLLKGKVPVDPECTPKVGKAHVYCEGNDVYDVMLNQTNLQFNNNKYYLIQLLEDDAQRNFSVWMRWGRVGKMGQHSLVSCSGDLSKAKEIFQKKFLDKTKTIGRIVGILRRYLENMISYKWTIPPILRMKRKQRKRNLLNAP